MKHKSWLVTGATGLLGANIGLALGQKIDLIGVARQRKSITGYKEIISADIANPEDLFPLFTRYQPDVTLHAAAMTSHEDCETNPVLARKINFEATKSLADIASSAASRFMFISTDAVFDGKEGNYMEQSDTNPFSVYGETKVLAEEYLLNSHANALIARVNFFGWSFSGTRSILEFFANNLRNENPVPGYTDFVVTSIYAKHLAKALFDLANSNLTGCFHVASSDALSKADFGQKIARQFGFDENLINRISADENNFSGISRKRNLALNTDKFQEIFGALPTQGAGIKSAFADVLE